MERQKMKALLCELGISGGKNGRFKNSGDNIQFCCPFHHETRPSAGIHIYNEYGECFACEERFNLKKLVAHCLDFTVTYKLSDGTKETKYDYARAEEWLSEKYNVDKKEVYFKGNALIRVDEEEENDTPKRFELPKVRIAPFKSGKQTHNYFFDRGFTKETVSKFMVGWDADKMRITVPVFWQDGALCGVIGRAVLEMRLPSGEPNPEFYRVYKESEKNDVKYYIYDEFPVGDILFPLPQFKLINDTAIIVEGQYDCMWLHQNEHPNTLSSLGSKLVWNKRLQSSKQIDLLSSLGVKKVILMRDNDKAGIRGMEHDYKLLKNDFIVYGVTYPEGKNDPKELTGDEIDYMLDNKYLYGMTSNKISRIE